jgi:hypothetical protein
MRNLGNLAHVADMWTFLVLRITTAKSYAD